MDLVQLAARSPLPSPGTTVGRLVPRAPGDAGTGLSVRRSARQVAEALVATSGLETWYVGRLDGEAVFPLAVAGRTGNLRAGLRVPFSRTVCRRMVNGLGPVVVGDLATVPNYARAPLALAHGLTAYAGIALRDDRGALLGTLAGWSTAPDPRPAPGLEDLLHAFAGLLSQSLAREVAHDTTDRRRERADLATRATDRVTTLSNRVGWGALLQREGRRSAERGEPVALLLLDVGRVRSAGRLQRATRTVAELLPGRVVSRLDARRFGAILTDVGDDAVETLRRDLLDALRAAGFDATCAWAASGEADDLTLVWQTAEQRLYRLRRDGAVA